MISNNIKYLRKSQNLTQGEFADKVGINRPAVGSYEEGRAEPKIPTLQKISELFNVSIESLISEDLSQKDSSQFQKDVTGDKLRVLSIVTDQQDHEYIQLVPQKASAGYTNGFSDPEFIQELPQIYLPMLDNSGTHRGFEIKGDSMLPLPSGSIIVGRYLDNWHDIKNDHTYIVITQKEGTVYKRVVNKIYEDGTLLLQSDNPVYSPYPVSIEDVREIWEGRMIISNTLPKPEIKEETETVKTLTQLVLALQEEISEIKKKI